MTAQLRVGMHRLPGQLSIHVIMPRGLITVVLNVCHKNDVLFEVICMLIRCGFVRTWDKHEVTKRGFDNAVERP